MKTLYDPGTIQEIRKRFYESQKPLIASHIRPDGDAIGSVVGLGLVLRKSEKVPCLVLNDGLPAKYRFLTGSGEVSNKINRDFDLAIALDCADPGRLGSQFDDIHFDINIDHHITNTNFADINLVVPEKAATAQILAEILPMIKMELDQESASAFLMGILTDSIGFRTSNVTPDTLKTSAELMSLGAELATLYQSTLVNLSFEASKLWGFALKRLVRDSEILWTSILLEDRQAAGFSGRDDADLTNILSAIEGVKVSILFNEQINGKVKVSWRSGSEVDVSKIALSFGGGGHPPAAGAELEGNLTEVQGIVLDRTRQLIGEIQ